MFSRYAPPAIPVPCQRAYATVSGTLARMRLLPNAKLLNISESISDFSHLIIKVSCIWKLKKLKRLEKSSANVPFPHPAPDIAHRASTCTIFAFPNAPEYVSTRETGKKQSNYAKQGVQTQESDYHSVAKSQTQLCNNHKSFSAHKRRFYAENKAYLQCKQAFVGTQDRLH